MASFNKFHQFVEDLAKGVHNLDTGTIRVYLSNATPSASGDAVKADLAEISTGAGYSGAIELTSVTAEQTSGTLAIAFGGTDPVITASGGTVGPFRYVPLYNDTPTSPADPLIGWWDYGSEITLADGESFTIDVGANILTIV